MKKENTNKTYVVSALIALAVSVGVLGGQKYLLDEKQNTVTLNKVDGLNAQQVLYTADKEGNITPLDFTDTSKKVLDAVVHIKATQAAPELAQGAPGNIPDPFKQFFGDRFHMPEGGMRQGPRMGTGSGVIINDKGYIITNNHVIENAQELEVTLHNNESYKATVVGIDPTTDLALLKITANNLKSVSLVNSDDVEVGEWVLAIGNPFSLTSTVTAGIVSAKARNININKDQFAVESFIQTDAAINPGNSGGALVNLNGDLIGINTAIASRTGSYSGYGFAVPSNIVTKVIEDLLEYGSVQRGMLGVSIITMDGAMAKEKGMDFVKGVWIQNVGEDSAADKSGIKAGDILTKVEDNKVTTSPRLQEIIAQYRPGDAVNVTVNRNGKEKTFEVILENSQGTTAMIKKEKKPVMNILGADFKTLDAEKAKALKIDGGVQVVNLYAGKLLQNTQIKTGFIITHVDGAKVTDVKELISLLEDKKGGILLEGIYENMPGKKYYALGME
ncbi:Do family serine endopeptidase [Maribacter chungangensis]|uniref:Do family serine endopeptidase n=1 Tax=Maribacter chungangensis TaxID=1069117 RepID=A0ABW3B5M3_9FLAO